MKVSSMDTHMGNISIDQERLWSVSLLCGAEKPENLKKPFW